MPSKSPAKKSPAGKGTAKKAAAGKATNSGSGTGPVPKRSGRIIGRVPEPLRPLARAAARSPLIKSAYRKATGRG